MTAAPEKVKIPVGDATTAHVPMWNVIVWDDPVNLMTYVVWVFRSLFGYSKEEATRLMLQVHNEGRAIVDSAPREQAEVTAFRLHHHGLWATLERG